MILAIVENQEESIKNDCVCFQICSVSGRPSTNQYRIKEILETINYYLCYDHCFDIAKKTLASYIFECQDKRCQVVTEILRPEQIWKR